MSGYKILPLEILFGILLTGGFLECSAREVDSSRVERGAITTTIITGKVHGLSKGDSVSIRISSRFVSDLYFKVFPHQFVSQKTDDGSFSFTFTDLSPYSYFAIYAGHTPLKKLPLSRFGNRINAAGIYLLKAGDSIYIDFHKDSITVTGRGANSLAVQIDEEQHRIRNQLGVVVHSKAKVEVINGRVFHKLEAVQSGLMQENMLYKLDSVFIEERKDEISSDYFKILMEKIKFRYYWWNLKQFRNVYKGLQSLLEDINTPDEVKRRVNIELNKVKKFYRSSEFHQFLVPLIPKSNVMIHEGVLYYNELASVETLPDLSGMEEYSHYVSRMYPASVRDVVLAQYILQNPSILSSVKKEEISANIKDPTITEFLNEYDDKSRIGQIAMPFALLNVHGDTVRLSDFRGKVVFIDFWFTGCGACRMYYKNVLSEVEEMFKKDDVVFLPICVDKTLDMFRASVKKGVYTSPDQSNVFNLSTAPNGSEHPLIAHYKVVGYPRPFIIGRDGKIFNYHYLSLREKLPLIQLIKAALKTH